MGERLSPDIVAEAIERAGLGTATSRRRFLLVSAGGLAGAAVLRAAGALGAGAPVVILEEATGLLLADPTRCVGCLRCEIACTEGNDGRAQPSLSRIKVSRHVAFGPEGPTGGSRMQGAWGNGLVVQDTCRQCPHPVPCATACPEGAIQVAPGTGARAVDAAACVGCRLCQKACPWGMMSFDEERQKATKCTLCDGAPRCVAACPAAALRYVPWRDLTRETPPRGRSVQAVPPATAAACLDCHAPGRRG